MKKRSIVALLLVLLLSFCNTSNKNEPKSIPMEMPNMTFVNLTDNTSFNTDKLKNNKRSILVFFSTSCRHCQALLKELEREKKLIKQSNVCLITQDKADEVANMYRQLRLSQDPLFYNCIDTQKQFTKTFDVKYLPFVLVYSSNGTLDNVLEGEFNISEIDDRKALAKEF